MPDSHYGGMGLIPVDPAWNLWWIKWQNVFFRVIPFTRLGYLFINIINSYAVCFRIKGPLTTTVSSNSLSPHSKNKYTKKDDCHTI